MITKFKLFEINSDIDPYGEEDWEDVDLVNITMKTPIKIGDMISSSSGSIWGKVERIETNEEEIYIRTPQDKLEYCSKPFLCVFDYKIKVGKQFEHNELDPYDEEDWEEPEILDDDLTEITMKTILKVGDIIYTSGNVYHGVITDVLKGKEYYIYNGIRKTYNSQQMLYLLGYKIKKKQ